MTVYVTVYVPAVCAGECQNGGTCDAPNHCSCPSGWQGLLCERRE